MDVYVYQAALLCEDCGDKRKANLTAPANPDNESSWDSNDYPKGPYSDGGGEADSPQHCDDCGRFLFNDLTKDGIQYVMRSVESFIVNGSGDESTLLTWLQHYDDSGDELYPLIRNLIRLRGVTERAKHPRKALVPGHHWECKCRRCIQARKLSKDITKSATRRNV